VEEKWMEKEEEEEILNLVNALPDLQQAVLRMKHIEGLEVDEIARIINSNAVAVRANLSRARRKVKEQFMKLR
jgi:RNA polymerase sigma-70 factor (ECF subfamily)